MIVYKLDKDRIAQCWPQMRPFLLSALRKYGFDDRYPLDHLILDLLTANHMACWAIVSNDNELVCATVTEINQYPLGRALNIFLTGGEGMSEWGDLLHDALVKYAKEENCKWIDTGSRRGIGKMFYDRLGYKRKQESYCFEVIE